MDARIPRIADTTMLFTAIVLGTALVPVIAFVGLPIAAAGMAGLSYRGQTPLAAIAAAAGLVAAGLLGVSSLVYVVPQILGVLAVVIVLPKRPSQAVTAALVGLLAAAGLVRDALVARSMGTTLAASVVKDSQTAVAEMTQALGSAASPDTVRALKDAANLVASAWPSAYFQAALIVGLLVVWAIAWAARRVERPLDVPTLARLDLTPHVLWVFVIGLLLLAASYARIAFAATLGTVGLNLVLCARTLFLLQGIGVAAGVLDRAGVGLGGRILALAAFAALDALTLAVSFTGLLDFWVNFRRLPREGAAPPAAEPDGRRW